MSDNKPVKTLRQGAVQAAIWQNTNDKGETHFNITVERTYRNDKEQWRSSHTFGHRDLLLLAKVANEAHTAVNELYAAAKAAKPGGRLPAKPAGSAGRSPGAASSAVRQGR